MGVGSNKCSPGTSLTKSYFYSTTELPCKKSKKGLTYHVRLCFPAAWVSYTRRLGALNWQSIPIHSCLDDWENRNLYNDILTRYNSVCSSLINWFCSNVKRYTNWTVHICNCIPYRRGIWSLPGCGRWFRCSLTLLASDAKVLLLFDNMSLSLSGGVVLCTACALAFASACWVRNILNSFCCSYELSYTIITTTTTTTTITTTTRTVAVSCSCSDVVQINVVALRPARLVLDGWLVREIDLCPTNHPGQLSLAISLWVGAMSTGQRAVMLCGWGVKAGMVHVCWQL